MKAELKPRINTEGRTKLENVIPLDTPFTLFVDPSSACNFKCIFCPTGDAKLIKKIGRYQGIMDMNLFKKIVDDMHEFPSKIKVLRMYKDGEPLLNKNFPSMIRHAKKENVADSIDTTTNAGLLTAPLAMDLIGAGIDRINISVNAVSDYGFMKFSGAKINFKKYVDNIKFLYDISRGRCEICIKIAGDNLNKTQQKKFFETFGDICDRIFIESFAPCWPEFDVEERTGVEIKGGIYKNELTNVNTCPYIFYSMSVNSDGKVSLCFLDWSRKLIIGDSNKESLLDIWNGKTMFTHRIMHLNGHRTKNSVCATCGQLTHCMPDNIDKYSDVILKRMRPNG